MPERRPSSAQPAIDAWLLTDIINRLRRVLRASIRDDYPWESLPMAQVEILQRLREEPGLRINDLATRHRLASNTVSVLVQQLVVAGLLSRTADPDDRRAVRLELSTDGTRMLADWQQAHERRLAAALEQLSPDEQDAVGTALPALARLVAELERADAAGQSEHPEQLS